ncbi:cyclic nucleotide-binding domain-containing protein [bacterium]|nr:cyclic nucleotide-binding domain-containing protein [bacterium]MBU1873682.1 cyclic nucleotide-binding domain-containing protein [bacterium]
MDNINTLRRSELCFGLNDNELEMLAAIFHSRQVNRNEIILKEGEPSNDLYIIARGRVKILMTSSSNPGDMEKIATLKDNEIYGEFALLDGSTRSASVIADEDSFFLYADYLDFHRFMEENEHIGFIIMKNLAKILTAKLRKTNFELRNGAY